jgi:tetratricopeptide (TPR) repeat protein
MTTAKRMTNKPMLKTRKTLFHPDICTYHANRAASLLQLGRIDETIDDCTIAILYNPLYVKAYTRRSMAHERNDDTESALADARSAFELQRNNAAVQKQYHRLEKIEKERMEKLKEETMGKLKDLGNSILRNFGLSLDNFQAVQDPNRGYSISFNQNK